MTNQQESAEEIFGAALDLPPGQRSAYLDTACGGSVELRLNVEELLLDHERLGDFLTASPLAPVAGQPPSPDPLLGNPYLTAGRKLGRYTILAPLGSGGMGAVYKARDERLERVVAIKVLSPDLFLGEAARDRFRKEALALARLSHTNIAAVYDVGEENGVDYIVMECISGQTLAAKLKLGSLPIAEAVAIAQQVASALEEAHEFGVIHRDLKPANIMVTARGNVKVLDFGIAKLAELGTPDPSMTGDTFIGTPLYMSPEQVQGKSVDTRTDLWSLGVVLYESLTSRAPFYRETSFAIMHAIVEQTPAPVCELRLEVPPAVGHIVTRLLEKDPDSRFQSAKEVILDTSAALVRIGQPAVLSEQARPVPPVAPSKSKPRKSFYYASAALIVLVLLTAAFLFRRPFPHALPTSQQWEQLTFFTDSAVYPALSSDGKFLAFIRGNNSFIGLGQIYVQVLPAGEPVQLTHDTQAKLSPSFSPDNSQIAYSTTDPWDTWEVPVLGGEPRTLLPNSSSLSWIEGGKRLLFSEIKVGLHLVVVTTDESRGDSRDVYDPVGNRSMAHHSYLSPDGRWVLVVEMNTQEQIVQCRVVPFQGPTVIKLVGPPNGSCRAGAWSPDGKWLYLAAKTDDFHLWRQPFPDGEPEQLTFGPTSQEGIAMAPDGKSLISSVGTTDHTVWLHDKDGDHQVSSEGDGLWPTFSSDGRSLYFLMANGQTHGEELWVKDLSNGKTDRVLPGYSMQSSSLNAKNYSVSNDGRQVAFVMTDQTGHSALWIAPTSHRSSPRRISSNASEDSPLFLPSGDLVFRAIEGGTNFLYRMKPDGTGRHKIIPDHILEFTAVSPDGRWAAAATADPDEEHPASLKAFAIDGGPPVTLCTLHCMLDWDTTGKFVYVSFPDFHEGSFAVPVMQDTGLPRVPPGGIANIRDVTNVKTIAAVPWNVGSAITPSIYAYTRENTRRNLYRIPLP